MEISLLLKKFIYIHSSNKIMPNRVLRDWTTSAKVEKLSSMAELFLVRLIMKADDYGAYWGDSRLLNANLFPLRKYQDKKIAEWRDECKKAGIIDVWKSKKDDREYLIIIDFGQRLRQMKTIFPRPDSDLSASRGQIAVNSKQVVTPETKRNETEVGNETESETNDKLIFGNPESNLNKVSIRTKYLSDRPMVIYDLSEYFSSTGQLDDLIRAKWTDFTGFMAENPGKVFDDPDHLYNAFKNFNIKPKHSNGGKTNTNSAEVIDKNKTYKKTW